MEIKTLEKIDSKSYKVIKIYNSDTKVGFKYNVIVIALFKQLIYVFVRET